MNRIALIGPKGVGKSLLAYTFSAFLKHRRMPAAAVNMDPAAYKLPYSADLDVRHFSRGKSVFELYPAVLRDDVFLDKMASLNYPVCFLDFSSGLDWLWFSDLPDFCDATWLVTSEIASAPLMAAVSEKLDAHVLNVVNQRRLLASDQKTLSAFSLPLRVRKDTVFVNAWERDGFDALVRHLGPLPQTA